MAARTTDNLLAIHGSGLKIAAPDGTRVKAKALAVNEPRHLKAIAPAALTVGTAYRLVVVTQSSAKGSSSLLKKPREVKSEFTLTAQAEA